MIEPPPTPLNDQVDELFGDASMHGPRWRALLRRAAAAGLLLGVTYVLGISTWWRGVVIDSTSDRLADVVLVAPVLAAIVVVGAALAPLARTRVQPLVGAGLVLVGAGAWLVVEGQLVAATLPSSVGAVLLGVATARVIRRAVWALPLLVAAGISDARSVDSGITSTLLDGADPVRAAAQARPEVAIDPGLVTGLDLLVLHVPAATGTWLLGIVDIIAIGLLLGLAHMLWLSVPRTAFALAIALAITVGADAPVPVLPVLGLAWVLAHARLVWRATRFSLRRLTYLGG